MVQLVDFAEVIQGVWRQQILLDHFLLVLLEDGQEIGLGCDHLDVLLREASFQQREHLFSAELKDGLHVVAWQVLKVTTDESIVELTARPALLDLHDQLGDQAIAKIADLKFQITARNVEFNLGIDRTNLPHKRQTDVSGDIHSDFQDRIFEFVFYGWVPGIVQDERMT